MRFLSVILSSFFLLPSKVCIFLETFFFCGGCLEITNNMKQKVVLKVAMNCQKCRTQALKTAAKQEGVEFVGLEGEQKDKVVVIGDGFDPIKLTTNLRKKVGNTEIITLAPQK